MEDLLQRAAEVRLSLSHWKQVFIAQGLYFITHLYQYNHVINRREETRELVDVEIQGIWSSDKKQFDFDTGTSNVN